MERVRVRVRTRARSRVAEALVCPFCRDVVARQGALACGRRRCGALYHEECWAECSQRYGGCAVFGCESERARDLSALRYVVRVLRVALAAAIFPARAVREIHARGRVGASVREALGVYLRSLDLR